MRGLPAPAAPGRNLRSALATARPPGQRRAPCPCRAAAVRLWCCGGRAPRESSRPGARGGPSACERPRRCRAAVSGAILSAGPGQRPLTAADASLSLSSGKLPPALRAGAGSVDGAILKAEASIGRHCRVPENTRGLLCCIKAHAGFVFSCPVKFGVVYWPVVVLCIFHNRP